MVIKSSEKELYKPIFTADKETLEAEVKKGTVVGKVHLRENRRNRLWIYCRSSSRSRCCDNRSGRTF